MNQVLKSHLDAINDIIIASKNLIDVKNYLILHNEAVNALKDITKNEALSHSNTDQSYYRTILFQNETVEVIGIRWNINSKTTVHDHSEYGCIMIPIFGKLIETLYDHSFNELSTKEINEISYIDNNIGYHKIESLDNSLSVHIYAPIKHITKTYL